VGTEEGSIHKCSKAYGSDYLATYSGHSMPVYAVKWNSMHPGLFLSCSADWSVKVGVPFGMAVSVARQHESAWSLSVWCKQYRHADAAYQWQLWLVHAVHEPPCAHGHVMQACMLWKGAQPCC
jgi:hypothetical protein